MKPKSGGSKSKDTTGTKQSQNSERELGKDPQQAGQEQQGQPQGQQQELPAQPDGSQQANNDRSEDAPPPPSEIGDLQDRAGGGRWGKLPRRVIEQMYDNGKWKLPEKYRLVLEEYWRRLPEGDSK